MLTKDDYKTALDIQDACNLSGVVYRWARIMERVCNEGYERGEGTEWKNSHPINVLFASKIASLTVCKPLQFDEAYDACLREAGLEVESTTTPLSDAAKEMAEQRGWKVETIERPEPAPEDYSGIPLQVRANPELAASATPESPRCRRCGRLPEEIEEYADCCHVPSEDDGPGLAPEDLRDAARDYMRFEEGTYNATTGGYWCTECYIAVGQPLGVAP
jgi:hypothetical protein